MELDKIAVTAVKNAITSENLEIGYYLIQDDFFGIRVIKSLGDKREVVFEKNNISDNRKVVIKLIGVIVDSFYNFDLLSDIIDDLRGDSSCLVPVGQANLKRFYGLFFICKYFVFMVKFECHGRRVLYV